MSKYTAVIIEPRCHKALSFVLNNILTNLPEEWSVLIFHGQINASYVHTILSNDLITFQHRILPLIQLEVENLTTTQYNMILMNHNFYQCIPTEQFLIFQTDSIILERNRALLELFLQYDYVGAPWKSGDVGNGGFSLRRKSKMIQICTTVLSPKGINEDVYFTQQPHVPLYMPSWETAHFFSVETIFHETSFGIHAAWKYMNKTELDFLVERNPEIGILIRSQN